MANEETIEALLDQLSAALDAGDIAQARSSLDKIRDKRDKAGRSGGWDKV